MIPDLTPENKILKFQLDELRQQYADLFEQKNHMRVHQEPYLTALYLDTIGKFHFKQFSLNLDLKILKRRIEKAQAFFNRNELPPWIEIDKQIKNEFEIYQKKLQEEAKNLANAKEILNCQVLSPEDAKKLKQVYYLLVKKLHPDINPSQTEEEKELFILAQAAYDHSDLATLNQILLKLKGETDTVDKQYDLKDMISHLQEMIVAIQQNILELEKIFPFSYREKLKDDIWIAQEISKIKEQIALLEEEIKIKNEYLALLMSWKPE